MGRAAGGLCFAGSVLETLCRAETIDVKDPAAGHARQRALLAVPEEAEM